MGKRGARPVWDASKFLLIRCRKSLGHHLVERGGFGSMAPIDAGCGAVFGWRGESGRATPRCRLTGEPGRHYVHSLRTRLRWRVRAGVAHQSEYRVRQGRPENRRRRVAADPSRLRLEHLHQTRDRADRSRSRLIRKRARPPSAVRAGHFRRRPCARSGHKP